MFIVRFQNCFELCFNCYLQLNSSESKESIWTHPTTLKRDHTNVYILVCFTVQHSRLAHTAHRHDQWSMIMIILDVVITMIVLMMLINVADRCGPVNSFNQRKAPSHRCLNLLMETFMMRLITIALGSHTNQQAPLFGQLRFCQGQVERLQRGGASKGVS